MSDQRTGTVTGVQGNLVKIALDERVRQNEVAHILVGDVRLKAEVIRVKGDQAEVQVYEETRGLRVGDEVTFSGELLSVELGPGLLGQVYDGLQNPLEEIAREHGVFLPRGPDVPALDRERHWLFTPSVKESGVLSAGQYVGWVPEGIFEHRILVPFEVAGPCTVDWVAATGEYTLDDTVAILRDTDGRRIEVKPSFRWPVRIPIKAYRERLRPADPLTTQTRIIDTLFPIAKGGTFCIPGPFGAGKTVLQQIMARRAEVDIVIIAACGERAGEVVDTLTEFPLLEDPRTGRSLMERTIIICNTSSMPVAARESSVYTAVTLAEYYRQMGLHVFLLADSTSRWAQAMREISGRLEEIPGDEAYPAYLESRIAQFYERAGLVRLHDGAFGSVTIGGTVSPAGGTFEEPVTQGTLKVVGAFHGLSRARASARRFPAIDPHESWSRYQGFIDPEKLATARAVLRQGRDTEQMMQVVGEEGTSLEDFITYLKSEFMDHVYLQQNAFDAVDGATGKERQEHVFGFLVDILKAEVSFPDKTEALRFFHAFRSQFINWNYMPWESEDFRKAEEELRRRLSEVTRHEENP